MEWLKKILEAIWAFLTSGSRASKPKEGWAGLIQAIKDSDMHPSQKLVCMAQAIIESARGTSELAKNANNFFGMKDRPELDGIAFGTYTYTDSFGDRDPYSAFATPAKNVEGYRAFINRSPYKGWEDHLYSPEAYIRFIFTCGYTVPPRAGEKAYDDKVIALFPEARELLEKELEVQPEEPPAPTANGKSIKLAIIVGHTKSAPGAYSKTLGQSEYVYNTDLANKLKAQGTQFGITSTIHFRDVGGISGAYTEALKTQPNLIMELHYNAFNGKASGSETLHFDDRDARGLREKELAGALSKAMAETLGIPNRGIKEVASSGERGFSNVAKTFSVPSVLIETGFGDNPKDATAMRDKKVDLAKAIMQTIADWA